MPPLPVISGMEVRRAFERAGFVFRKQRGSHMILVKTGHTKILSIPNHKELDRGTLRKLITDSGLTVEEFYNYLG